MAFYFPGQKFVIIFAAIYLLFVVLLATPYLQRHALYLNGISIPIFADYSTPEKYGLAPNRTVNLKIKTPDNETIGAWFVFSDAYYQSLPSIPTNPAEHITSALNHSPVVLFFHGNGATRAFSARVRHYQGFTSRIGANVLTIDYRGFGDSTGTPSESGLVMDAKAAFDWLVNQGKNPEDILIIGHSLGTGVGGQLAATLANEGIECKGIVLLSPFSSIARVLEDYNLFGFIPLIKPISLIPGAVGLINRVVIHRFDTLQAVPNITSSVLIAHAEDDWDIPHTHSDVLFQAFLQPLLPPPILPEQTFLAKQPRHKILDQLSKRRLAMEAIVQITPIAKFGRIKEFRDGKRHVVLVKTHVGGHNYLGIQEGLVDIIGKKFGLLSQ